MDVTELQKMAPITDAISSSAEVLRTAGTGAQRSRLPVSLCMMTFADPPVCHSAPATTLHGIRRGRRQAWNCLLVVSENGKDGILVGKEPDAERYYMAHMSPTTRQPAPAVTICRWSSGPTSVPPRCSCSRHRQRFESTADGAGKPPAALRVLCRVCSCRHGVLCAALYVL